MKVQDSVNPTGDVRIDLIDKVTGKVVRTLENHNLVVKIGRGAVIDILAGVASGSITKMAVGKGGTQDLVANAFSPIPPIDSDEDLHEKVTTKEISSRTVDKKSSKPRVTFVTLFDCAEVNSLVNECGLYFNNGTMFARHTFDTVSLKASSGFAMQISWTTQF